MNHSPAPNTGALPDAPLPVVTVAMRDIAAGEELTCDYLVFDTEAANKLR
jgi:SET domain-containing protein